MTVDVRQNGKVCFRFMFPSTDHYLQPRTAFDDLVSTRLMNSVWLWWTRDPNPTSHEHDELLGKLNQGIRIVPQPSYKCPVAIGSGEFSQPLHTNHQHVLDYETAEGRECQG